MDDDVLGGYREAAPPKAERFPLRMGAGARLSMLVSLGGIAFTVRKDREIAQTRSIGNHHRSPKTKLYGE